MAAQCATECEQNPLWDYALACYSKPGVQQSALRLQDEFGLDVLLLLADRWLATQEQGWPVDAQQSLQTYFAWRDDMVVPLRTLRQRLDKSTQPLREQLLTAELSAERMAMDYLYQALQSHFNKRCDLCLWHMPWAYSIPNAIKKEAIAPLFKTFVQQCSA